MSAISETIASYAQGQIDLQEALNQMRQITPNRRSEVSNPYVDDLEDEDGGFDEVFEACIIYDCTKEEFGLFNKALAGTAVGPQEKAPKAEFTPPASVLDLFAGPGDEEDPDIEADLPVYEPFTVEPGSVEEEQVEEEPAEQPVAKHTPGGVQHPQEYHGNWADGSAPDTTSSGGSGGTIPQTGGPAGSNGSAPPARSSTVQPEVSTRPGGRVSRPKTLDALIGQDRVRKRLQIKVDAARQGGRPLDHILLTGPPGLGKTTMAKALANEMGGKIKVVGGGELKSRKDLKSMLIGMEDGDIVFIDEIHAIPKAMDEALFPILEDGEMDVRNASGGLTRVKTPNVTFLGATTNPEGVAKPLRDRFGATERLSLYKDPELAQLAKISGAKQGLDIPDDVATLIASASRGTPRAANKHVRNLKEFIGSQGGAVDIPTTRKMFNLSNIDARGLHGDDRKVLGAISDLGTAGINTLSAATAFDPGTIAQVIEPYLLRQGLINRTPKGRTLTQAGKLHLETYGRDELEDFFSKRMGGDEPIFNAPVEIMKADKRQNLVFGWANVTFEKGNQVVDHQGHMIDVEELESAAYNFAVKYRKTGDNHKGEGFGELVESLVVTKDKIAKGGFPEDMLGKWWIGFRVPPEDWDKVERGERSMFSIQGRAQLEAV